MTRYNKYEYVSSDVDYQGQEEVEESCFEQDTQDCYYEDTQEVCNDCWDEERPDTDVMQTLMEQEQEQEKFQVEIAQPIARVVISTAEMDKEYEEYKALCLAEKLAKRNARKAQAKELADWAQSCNMTVEDIPGSFEQKLDIMKEQKARVEEIELALAKERLAKEELARVTEAKVEAEKARKRMRKAGKERENRKNGPNAQGKTQGVKKVVEKEHGKRVERRIAQEKAQKVAQELAKRFPVQPKAEYQPEIEKEEDEEEDEVVVVKAGAQIELPSEPKIQDPTPVDDWTVVKAKKPSEKPVEAPIIAGLPYKPAFDSSNMTRTRMCSSVGTRIPCKHGSRCLFAHSQSELRRFPCRYGDQCKYKDTCKYEHGQSQSLPQSLPQSQSQSQSQSRKPCKYGDQCRYKSNCRYDHPVAKVPEPIVLSLKPTKAIVSQVAPWAKPAVPRKTRWGPEIVPVQAPVQAPRKTRWS